MELSYLEKIKRECLEDIIRQYKRVNAGHVGSSLSCVDILVYVFFSVMSKEDKMILSKGHAALSLYVVLAKAGYFDHDLLDTFYGNGTLLAAHPPCNRELNGVHFGTGSLGHGLSLAAGLAFSNTFTHKKNNVFCILSDGDCDEGSTWEAALFAGHHRLKNLFVIIDNNNLQGFGRTEEVLDIEPLVDKWKSFNFDVVVAEDGNDFQSLDTAFTSFVTSNSDRPKCIIAKTIKGSGVSYMEDKMEWHYLPMNDEQYMQALEEIKNT